MAGGVERVTGVAAAWPGPSLVSSRRLLALQVFRRLWGGLVAALDAGGELGSRGVVFAVLRSPCAPSEGNLGVESRREKQIRVEPISFWFRGRPLFASRQVIRAVASREEVGGVVIVSTAISTRGKDSHIRECLVSCPNLSAPPFSPVNPD